MRRCSGCYRRIPAQEWLEPLFPSPCTDKTLIDNMFILSAKRARKTAPLRIEVRLRGVIEQLPSTHQGFSAGTFARTSMKQMSEILVSATVNPARTVLVMKILIVRDLLVAWDVTRSPA